MINYMITYKIGNIFNEDVEAIVNTVNCVGIMGKGLALQFKNKYYNNFKLYANACRRNEVVTGKVLVYKIEPLFNPKYIINFPTKQHWRDKSKIEYIETGLDDLVQTIHNLSIKSIAIPPLGCGLGGLNWNVIKQLIEEKLSGLNCNIIVLEPLN